VAVEVEVGDAVTIGVVVAVHATVGEVVAGSRTCGAAIVSLGLGEMDGRAGAVQPHAKARSSSPLIIRTLIYPDAPQVANSSTDFLRSPAAAGRIAQGLPDVKERVHS
jgi:hypothetical protein